MIVCICNNVSDRHIREAVNDGIESMSQLRDCLRIGTCCGKCHPHAKQVLRECVTDATKVCPQEPARIKAQPVVFHPGLAA